MAVIVGIVSRRGLRNKSHRRNKCNKRKLALYKPLLQCKSYLKQLYMSNKTERFSYKGGYGCVGVHIPRRLKEELAWATDKWLQVINNIILFKTVTPLRN